MTNTGLVEDVTPRPIQIQNGHADVLDRPGLGIDARARIAVDHVVLGWDGLKVVDADAITHFVGRVEALAEAKGQCILTPHPGELGRLLGKSGSEIERDRFGAVREAVARTQAIVVLKGEIGRAHV